jgi:ankyrin repeat protein
MAMMNKSTALSHGRTRGTTARSVVVVTVAVAVVACMVGLAGCDNTFEFPLLPRYVSLFAEQARLAAEVDDFNAFHQLHDSIRKAVDVSGSRELLNRKTLDKSIDGPALFHAAYLGHASFVQQYIEGGYPLNITVDVHSYLNHWRMAHNLSDVAAQHSIRGTEVPVSVLHMAILGKHNHLAEQLLHSGIVAQGPNGAFQPLHLAALTNNADMIDTLVMRFNSSTDVQTTELDEVFTPLHFAALYGNADAINRLLALGADVNSLANPTGRTVLFLAVLSNSTAAVELLLSHNASCSLQGSDPTTLHVAVSANNYNMLKLLLERASCNISATSTAATTETSLQLAVRYDRLDMAELLVEHGANLDIRTSKGDTALHIAAKNDAIRCLKHLLDAGAEVDAQNYNNFTVLHMAASAGRTEAVKLLIDAGADPNIVTPNSHNALELAIMAQRKPVVEFLATHSRMNLTAGAPVSFAALTGSLDLLEILLDAGAPINDPYGESQVTPLHMAASYNKGVALRFLVMRGAQVEAVDAFYNTPLIRAAFTNSLDSAETLVSLGANLEHQNERGDTAMHIAVDSSIPNRKVNPKLVDMLLKAGANLDIANNKGFTPLHTAVALDSQDMVARLVSFGADIDALNNDGLTASELARHSKKDASRIALLLAEQVWKADPGCCFEHDWIKSVSYATRRVKG